MKVAIWPDFFPVSFLISVVPSSLEFVAISKGKDKDILQQMLYKLSKFSLSSGNERKELREREQARTFSFPLFFIFFELSFLFSLSFSPRSVFFSLVPTHDWEPVIMSALWGAKRETRWNSWNTLEEARAPKLTWAPGHPDFKMPAFERIDSTPPKWSNVHIQQGCY